MSWDRSESGWNQYKGKARQQWGELTDDDLEMIAGKREELIVRLRERYGETRDGLELEVDEWSRRV